MPATKGDPKARPGEKAVRLMLPESYHARLRVLAARNGKDMANTVKALVMAAIDADDKTPTPTRKGR